MDKQLSYAKTDEKMTAPFDKIVGEIRQLVPHVLRLTTKRLYTTYDEEVDVLYISFEKPPRATHSEMRDDGVLLNFRNEELVGVTIFDASTICIGQKESAENHRYVERNTGGKKIHPAS